MAKVFFYGTLMRGFPLAKKARILGGLSFCGRGWIKGKLFDLGPYPAAIESDEGLIFGELYELKDGDAETLKLLDRIEAFDPERPELSLYARKQVEVQLEGGPKLLAWVYFYKRPLEGARPILSGDYRRYILQLRKGRVWPHFSAPLR